MTKLRKLLKSEKAIITGRRLIMSSEKNYACLQLIRNADLAERDILQYIGLQNRKDAVMTFGDDLLFSKK